MTNYPLRTLKTTTRAFQCLKLSWSSQLSPNSSSHTSTRKRWLKVVLMSNLFNSKVRPREVPERATSLLQLQLVDELNHQSNWCLPFETWTRGLPSLAVKIPTRDLYILVILMSIVLVVTWKRGYLQDRQVRKDDLKEEEPKSNRKFLTFLEISLGLGLIPKAAWAREPNPSTSRRRRKGSWTCWPKRRNGTM